MEKENNDYREQAEFLWNLLDDISSAGELVKPENMDSWDRYGAYIQKKLRKRFNVFQSDGDKLFTNNEWAIDQEKRRNDMIKMLGSFKTAY